MSRYCSDCELEYDCTSQVHLSVCSARTCDVCEEVFTHVLHVNRDGERVCDGCQESQSDADIEYSSEEEMEEEG